ncbi:flippase [Shewanella baltica]|uniref:flippase n=1 Tax=Shewanella baltica TaxID=62322 RepID=UPI0024BBE032|nr:flippase [Shewanella baltica]
MSIIKDSTWNIAAIVIPTLVALPVLGLLARMLDVELFGIFTLIFAMLGYASVFDMGLSRALIRSISINRDSNEDIKEYLFTSSITVVVIGCIISFAIFLFKANIATLLNVTELIYADVVNCLYLISFVIPFLLLNIVWQSYLEGLERFKELSILKIITSILLSVMPLFFMLIKNSIVFAVAGLVLARLISFLVFYFYTYFELKQYHYNSFFNKSKLKELFKFGSWLTISNIISPMMVYFDRFVLSSMVGASNVALYTAPSEIVSKLLMVPSAVSKTLFPKISNKLDIKVVYKVLLFLLLIVSCLTLPFFIFSEQILTLWLGSGYEAASTTLRILLVGLIFNSLAQVPYTYIQAKGFSNVTAKIHLLEVIPYFMLLNLLVDLYSFNGAALAWSLRVFIDCCILFIFFFKMKKL